MSEEERKEGRLRMNKVFRKCDRCNFETDNEDFNYLGDGVFSCPKCGCMWTTITRVVEE